MTTEAETCSLFRITDKLIQGIEHELIKHGWGVRYTWDECGLTFFLDRTNETDEALEFERVIVRLPLGDCERLHPIVTELPFWLAASFAALSALVPACLEQPQ